MEPLFVFGVSRGGTNLVARILNEHPRIVLALDPLLPLLSRWRSQIIEDALIGTKWSGSWNAQPDFYFDPWGPTALKALVEWTSGDLAWFPYESKRLVRSVAERATLEDPTLGHAFMNLQFQSPTSALTESLETVVQASGCSLENLSWVGFKEVWSVDLIPAIARVLPSAKFVIVQRDPRAIIHSLLEMSSLDPTQAAHVPSYMRHWRKQTSLVGQYTQMAFLKTRILVTRYEDVLANAWLEIQRLADFLGVHGDANMLLPGARTGWKGNSSFGPLNDAIDETRMHAWRRGLREDRIELVEALVAPEMMLGGYQCEMLAVQDDLPHSVEVSLRECNEEAGTWRSDSGDPAYEFTNESTRRVLLRSSVPSDWEDVQRNFLFDSVFLSIRSQLAGVLPMSNTFGGFSMNASPLEQGRS